ncbi:NAD kinase-like [Protopterus annectens]|uniref:NAD kinase-like n=1 Tax=Protopterus annectens TaxID=7888 RepID=UPI001CF9C268|nr:NAD kinase-like [Protopterus annectens]XP_043926010.1 NAD kinase-like [Protopterus annectens]XP_043926011.1 NAD kinase-like [Protopterus annectens]
MSKETQQLEGEDKELLSADNDIVQEKTEDSLQQNELEESHGKREKCHISRRRKQNRKYEEHESSHREKDKVQASSREHAVGNISSRQDDTEPSNTIWDGCRRARFLHGPCPAMHFGPKACILPNTSSVMHIQDPFSQKLTWNNPPVNALVIKKIRDESLLGPFKQLCTFLIEEKKLSVYVEKKVVEDRALAKDEDFNEIRNQLCTFREGYDDISDCIDLIICLGGDGTLLYASSLFQHSVPPVMAFHLGSFGFLTPFKFETYKTDVSKVIEGSAAIILRSRLKVKVVKKLANIQETESRYKVDENGLVPQSSIDTDSGKIILQVQVLNEVVVDRGPSSYLSNLDLYLDGRLITSVQGDGVIVSTPTGSTAYAAAAGASMIHPNVPAIMITPICPHSLSFRPIVVPAGVELMITLDPSARNTAWISFDGRKRQEIRHGDSIQITTSCYPLPSICCHDLVYDWFEGLAECLHWNVRKKQTKFTEMTDSSDTDI